MSVLRSLTEVIEQIRGSHNLPLCLIITAVILLSFNLIGILLARRSVHDLTAAMGTFDGSLGVHTNLGSNSGPQVSVRGLASSSQGLESSVSSC